MIWVDDLYFEGLTLPELIGTERQKQYADKLRKAYIKQHPERFLELDEICCLECDKRSFYYMDEDTLPSYGETLNEAEKAVLMGSHSGGG